MNLIRHFFTHWQTSFAGAALAVLQVILNGRDGKTLALAAFAAALGAVAKDPASKP
jgi:hypothetical protein